MIISGLRTELAVVQEQRQSIQTQLMQTKSDAQDYRAESTTKEAELLQRIEDIRKEVEREVLRNKDLKSQSERDFAEAIQQTTHLQSQLTALQSQLESTLASCVIHERDIEGLKSQILGSTTEYENLKERNRSLTARYEQGDLVRMPQTADLSRNSDG